MARLVVTASLVLFSNQACGSIRLSSGSQFNPRKLGLASVLYGADWTVLANLESMRLELATFGCHATEFMQVPNASSDLIHRTDRDNGSVVGDVVANHSLEHACLCIRWASRLRWFLAFPNAPLGRLSNRTAGFAQEVKVAVSAFFLSFCLSN
jgi:hypothetical protein